MKTVAVGTMYHDSHVGPNLQVGNFLALYVNTDNIGTDPGRQKTFTGAKLLWPNNSLVMAPVGAETFSTEGSDISETFWKLKQQLEPGCKTEVRLLPQDNLISERF